MRKLVAASLFSIALATTAYADGNLSVVVRGPIDGTALRTQLARELNLAIAPADQCPSTCLEIVVTDNHATVAYTANGMPRSRVVELGTDRSQWSTLITLLAGNLVRDEAADVLADLPAPPAPEPEPVVEEAPPPAAAPVVPTGPLIAPPSVAYPAPVLRDTLFERQQPELPFAIGFVPGLSTDGLRIGRVRHAIGFHAIAGVTGGSSLLSISGIADIQNGDASGLQLGGIATVARSVSGMQIGGIASFAEDSHGVQIGGIASVSKGGGDFQLAGIVSAARGKAGAQIAGIGAIANDSSIVQLAGIGVLANGSVNVQVAGIASAARGHANTQVSGITSVAGTSNVQVAGIVNAAHDANVQVSGIVNVADTVRGLQLGTVNIARRTLGTQIGVVNVGSPEGFSLGLINIVPGGRTDLEATYDSSNLGTVIFRHGGRNWHNVYGVAGHKVDEANAADDNDDVWMYGFGFGPSKQIGRAGRLDTELIAWQVNHGARHSTDVSILGQLRVTYAHDLGGVSIVGGGVLNTYISDDQMSPLLIERRSPGEPMDPDITVKVWPSAFVGVRL